MRGILTSALLAGVMASPVTAEDAAFIIGNEDYRSVRDLRGGDEAADAGRVFARQNVLTVAREDANTEEVFAALEEFVAQSVQAERVLVTLTGRFVHSDREAWFLPTDVPEPTLANMSRFGLPLSTVMTVLGRHPGGAVLLLGTDDEADAIGDFLTQGIGTLDIPSGVTVWRGDARDIAALAEGTVANPGADLPTAARNARLTGEGYQPARFVFLVPEGITPQQPATQDPAIAAAEPQFWDAAKTADSIAGYENYLRRYPEGANAAAAKAAINSIKTEPNRAERLAEEALGLTRDQRREIQRDLSILDIDPRGIDGIFGPGSRGAITRWQKLNAFSATGYLTRDQIVRLDAQAEKRAAELEAEAEARRIEQERADRAFWAETGAAGDEPGLRVYLKKYPDGIFAELAQERLAVFEEARRQTAAGQDRAAWDVAANTDTEAGYREYLSAYPQGSFAEDAKARLAEISQAAQNSAALEAAQRAEQSLGLNPVTSRIIEERLTALGLKPGPADGVFDDKTRRAIRRYQQARQLTVSGYLNQQTVVRLLADSILR